jgi:CRP-like cAMP-binding protein
MANSILDRLSRKTLDLLAPHISTITLPQGKVLHEVGSKISDIYFPLSGAVSLLVVFKKGEPIEVGLIDRKGFVGGNPTVEGRLAFGQALVQIKGEAVRVSARAFKKVQDATDDLSLLIDSYQSTLYFQAQQAAACNAHHVAEARICSKLLQMQDVGGGGSIEQTQELLGKMMGVRRTTVSAVANKLQKLRLITYARGNIHIKDRAGLEKAACECYVAIRRHNGK